MENDKSSPFVDLEENVVLSDLLFFVANRINTHPIDSIISVCDKFYDEKTVSEERVKFYGCFGKKASPKRSDDKKLKELNDIVNEMKLRDRSNSFMPTFAAVNLHHIPTTDDGIVTNAQLLASLQSLRSELVSKEGMITSIAAARDSIIDAMKTIRSPAVGSPFTAGFSPRASSPRRLPIPVDRQSSPLSLPRDNASSNQSRERPSELRMALMGASSLAVPVDAFSVSSTISAASLPAASLPTASLPVASL